MKVFHNRTADVANELEQSGLKTYRALTVKALEVNGRLVHREKPLINSLLFVSANASGILDVKRRLAGRAAFYCTAENSRTPAVIDRRQMEVFMLLNSIDPALSSAEYLGADTMRYSVGDKVRVTAGPLQGAEGHICRIKGNRRLVVTVDGVCAIATTYVPACFLEKVEA